MKAKVRNEKKIRKDMRGIKEDNTLRKWAAKRKGGKLSGGR